MTTEEQETKVLAQRQQEQNELQARQATEIAALEARHRSTLVAMQEGQVDELQGLKRRHLVEMVQLWARQGRELGAWARSVLGPGKRGGR
jgi:hypothetical protein